MSERERGPCGLGEANIIREVFPIAPIQLIRYARYGGSTGISDMDFSGIEDVASSGR